MAAVRRLALALLLSWACALLAVVPASAAEFERSVPVGRGGRLDVRLFGGEVVVQSWDRDVVRLRATHFATDRIDVRTEGGAVTVRARSRVGTSHAIDVRIDVPAWLPVSIAGTYLDIAVTGTRAPVVAETVRGDVRVSGGTGSVSLKSIEGEVVLEGAQGRAVLTAVNNDIRVNGLSGDLAADTVNGSVKMEGVRSRSVDVGTVGGDITWIGALADGGHYQFATHAGDIDVTLEAQPNAAVSVRSFEGHFRSTYPAALAGSPPRKRFRFMLGSGAATLDLETFLGTISLRRPESAARD